MRKILFFLLIFLIVPVILYAKTSYFLACQEGTIVNVFYKEKSIKFKRGDLFEVPTWARKKHGDSIINDDNRGACWSDSGNTTCPLVVHYGNELYGRTFFGSHGSMSLHGFVDLTSGCWFTSESPLPIKDKKNKFIDNILGTVTGTREEYFEKYLDKEFVDIICAEHPTKFNVAGITFTDIKKERSEAYVKKLEDDRLRQQARDEEARQMKEAREEKNRQEAHERERVNKEENDKLQAIFKKYNVEQVVTSQDLLVNPFRYKGKIVATFMVFVRMIEETVGIFSVDKPGYPTEDMLVSNLSADLFEDNSFLPVPTFLIVKVKGTIPVTNGMGALMTVPHFEYITKIIID